MQEAVPLGVSKWQRFLECQGEAVEAVLEEIPDVFVANYNCPGTDGLPERQAVREKQMRR